MNDTKEFARMVTRLKYHCKELTGKDNGITLIFDHRNNSEDNIKLLISGDNPFHYVGGLKKGQAPALWVVPKEEYTPLLGDDFIGQSAYRQEVCVFGQQVTGLIVHNTELEKGQMQGIKINIDKTKIKLLEIQENLVKRAEGKIIKGKKPTVDSVNKLVESILKTEFMKDIFEYRILTDDNNIFLRFGESVGALEKIRYDVLGKTALFTDRSDLSNEEIVAAYRSAWHVERSFRQMKDTKHLTTRPKFHWTDQKIKIHIFTCVLAYRMCCLLARELSAQGIQVSINQLIEHMTQIKKIDTFFGDIEKPEKITTFTCGSELAQQVLSFYKLKEKYT
jgi:transposase